MKFDTNDPVDALHCLAIKHEYLRCRDTFELFRITATGMVLSGHSKHAAYRAYNAYSGFILHLYEFLIALHARDYGNTDVVQLKGKARNEALDALVNEDIARVVQNRIDQINRGHAPSHENSIDYYYRLLPIPDGFAQGFRRMRNKVGGHVAYERFEETYNLTAFYQANHPYLYLLYRDIGDYWGRHCEEIPDLSNVTNFFKTILNSEA
ncbi:hypothetical protein D16iCDA_08770 [Pseudomonas seleniipraecipitans]|uniref:HEPN AbiU2-like domain-containing protein n=1 Tax=Phytopseudomonas seleniipraecipitans TaxID=640205 RepID=A0ABY5JDU8_9GAMM|nr:hypothetical protein [Pseudomonas seleniipraecipitans]UUD65726.1 hypothetical protein D16iCDA_08770 [Pseudomonas seleniipraecipitans]